MKKGLFPFNADIRSTLLTSSKAMLHKSLQPFLAGILLLLTLVTLFGVENAIAGDEAANDTCLSRVALVDRGLNDLITFGFAELISEGFELENANTASADRPEGSECKSHSNEIRFCYNPSIFGIRAHPKNLDPTSPNFDVTSRCYGDSGPMYHTLHVSDGVKYYDGAFFQAVYIADAVCVQFLATALWRTLGCKYRQDPPPIDPAVGDCYAGDSCANTALRESKNFFSVTGPIVQCVSETLKKIFQDTNNCTMPDGSGARSNLFITFQNSMKKSISVALTLYVIFFSIKVILGEEMPKKSELFIFMIKMVLVVHFALGNGLSTQLVPAFQGAAAELASIMFRAGGARGLCLFNAADYHDPTMALWDSLDCRMGYYLGINTPGSSPYVLVLAILLFPLFFFYLVFIVFLLAFALFFISVAMYVMHNYVLALIFQTLTLYLGPLFIPMVLFKQTRGYFDGWLKLLLSFTLQPAILFAFLALILTIFDGLMYPGCEFTQTSITVPWAPGKVYPLYSIDTSHLSPADKTTCEASFAYQIDALAHGSNSQSIDLIFMTLTIINTDTMNDLFLSMVKLVLFGFIAAHFLELLSGFAAELTGGQLMTSVSMTPFSVANFIKEQTVGSATGGKGKESGTDAKDAETLDGMDAAEGGGG